MKFGPLFPKRSAKAEPDVAADAATGVPPEAESIHHVPGERGIASVNQSRSLQSRVGNLMAMGMMSTLAVGLLTWYYVQTYSHRQKAQDEAKAATQSKAQGDMPLPALGPIDPPELVPTRLDSGLSDRVLGGRPPLPADRYGRTASYASPDSPEAVSGAPAPAKDRRLEGPVFTDSGANATAALPQPQPQPQSSSARSSLAALAAGAQLPAESLGGAPNSGTSATMAAYLRPSVTSAVSASVLPTQQLLLPKGAFIDCTLETAIDSSLPGLTTCITATDTFGADGKVVLLERGTKLFGETRGEVKQGSARVFVLWTEARTPTGVVVPLASPGTDELGRSGLAGTVDRHFMDRFGAAILISMIDGAIQAASQSRGQGGTVIYNPTEARDIVTEVLKSTVNIAPTVRKRNGDRIQILVARDLDFRPVYELRSTAHAR